MNKVFECAMKTILWMSIISLLNLWNGVRLFIHWNVFISWRFYKNIFYYLFKRKWRTLFSFPFEMADLCFRQYTVAMAFLFMNRLNFFLSYYSKFVLWKICIRFFNLFCFVFSYSFPIFCKMYWIHAVTVNRMNWR